MSLNPLLTIRRDRKKAAIMAVLFFLFGIFAVHFDASWLTPDSLDTGGPTRGELLVNVLGWIIVVVAPLRLLETLAKTDVLAVGFEGIVAPKVSSELIVWDNIEAIHEVSHGLHSALAVHLRDGCQVTKRPLARLLHLIRSVGRSCGDVYIIFANTDYPARTAIDAITNHFPVTRLR